MQVNRFDVGGLSSAQITPNGYLLADCYPTRAGVFEYRRADGSIVREFRSPEEVFSAQSLQSLQLLPVTNDHPSVPVSPGNVKSLSVGTIGQIIQQDGLHVKAQILITDPTMIDILQQRRKDQLSCGYSCDLDQISGSYNGQRYDAIQRNIVYNHVAVVNKGRAGDANKIHLDSNDAIMAEEFSNSSLTPLPTLSLEEKKPPLEQTSMIKVKLDGVDYDMPEVSAQIVNKLIEANKAELSQQTARADALAADLDTAKAELQKAKDPARIAEAVKSRLDLERVAERVKLKADSLTDEQIKVEVVKSVKPALKLDGKDAAYIDAAFDIARCELEAAPRLDSHSNLKSVADVKPPLNSLAARQARIDAANAKSRARN